MGEGGVDFQLLEERDGLRFTWHNWPASKLEATRAVVPIACVYTPLKQIDGMPPAMEYEPVKCKQPKCNAVLNPYCHVDFVSKHWTCPFCLTRNVFPPHYAENITETNLCVAFPILV